LQHEKEWREVAESAVENKREPWPQLF